MQPKSFSATALNVAELCPARYKAEHMDRSRGIGNSYATLGSTVHQALELYVKQVYINKLEEPNFQTLYDFLKLAYFEQFHNTDYDSANYLEAYEMISGWFKRHDLDEITRVISAEVKDHFDVQTSLGPIPFNYIWDRFDEKRPGVFRVVDYKSNRWNITHEDLKKKIQPRAYALSAAIQLKREGIEYKEIWVEFDMLRHDTLGLVFSREDNVNTWNYIHKKAEELIATDDNDAEERLNAECRFCVRKSSCKALIKNVASGGIHGLTTVEDMVDLRATVEWQKNGLVSLLNDLDSKILTEAKVEDRFEFESDDNRLVIGVSSQRAVDAERVHHVIGDKLFEQYGDTKITMASIDKLLKSNELDASQKSLLRSLIYQKTGEPRVKVESKNVIDPD